MIELSPHLWTDEKGNVRVQGTRMKILHLAGEHLVHGLDADRLHEEYPDLTMEQIHAALEYIDDHRTALQQELVASLERVEALRAKMGTSSMQERARRLKHGG